MIILHATFLEGEFLLWGETPGESVTSVVRKPRSKNHLRAGPANPNPLRCDAGVEKLSSVLKEIGFDFKVIKKSTRPMVAWLPTLHNQPVPSSPLIGEFPESAREATLVPWKVTGFRLPLEKAVEFLCRSTGKQILGPGMIVGKDLTFWAIALRFAAAFVTRGQFLPDISEIHGISIAHWRPIFSGFESERLSKLSKSMPAVARALSLKDASPPTTSPISLLSGFISLMVDHLVRSAGRENFWHAPVTQRRYLKKIDDFYNIHDQWLKGLCSHDGGIEGKAAELLQLINHLKDWIRPISVSAASPFRLCFRIEEPHDGNDKWYVRYFLQANHDPSLLIPAEEVWKGKDTLPFTDRDFNSHEYLLLSLGQASGICPHIETSLRTTTPSGYRLDATGAYEFLTQKALIFEQSGFGVMLPAWWTRKGTKLRLTARANVKTPEMQSASGLSLDQIVQFDWEVALGGEKLSFEELQRLAKFKAPLVKVRGQWVLLDAKEIQAAIQFWKRKASEQTTLRKVVRMALGGGKAPGNIPVEEISASGWIADLLRELDGKIPFQELSQPQAFHGTLRPYQMRGYSWLSFLRKWGLGACLADDMGLGKTIQALALIQKDWESGERRPVLLICPTSVVNNWQKESNRFTPELPVMVHHGIERKKNKEFKTKAMEHAIVISSYALLTRDFETFKDLNWVGVVLDEAQNIKNPETKQAKAARAIQADYRIALTGTPVENNVGDLWSIMEFLNSNFLGTQAEFKNRFFIPIQAARDPEATERLKRLTGPFILRRLKTDKTIIDDLPEKMEMKVFCTLTKEQASLYEAVVKETMEALDETEGIQRKGVVLATLLKLKQVCNHPAHFLGDNSPVPGRSGKLTRLTEIAEEMAEVGDRALIFTQFAEMGAILQRYLQETFGREVLFLYGGTPKKHRDQMVERFQAHDDGPFLFILSLKAGGTGLNLTRANHVIHFDRWWNPAVENQATDRAFRIGQTKNVQVHKFICAGTLEEKIDEMIERKKEVAERVIGTGEAWLTELSTAELKNLFSLRKEAIGE
ncbi:MAG: ATP-dependent helicase [Deltaproteobacteria bacterium CG03_land_8_20_14_0_80_45_14]|nr:MAG: ATP-dependent helicase [Deltaproteobacteria bacterium CG03_land_8_20_14_0_80_45_14]